VGETVEKSLLRKTLLAISGMALRFKVDAIKAGAFLVRDATVHVVARHPDGTVFADEWGHQKQGEPDLITTGGTDFIANGKRSCIFRPYKPRVTANSPRATWWSLIARKVRKG
jgi:hypothetical protein